ncbi:hypothetical protein Tco_0850725, partial [Tanacetum coccineum]
VRSVFRKPTLDRIPLLDNVKYHQNWIRALMKLYNVKYYSEGLFPGYPFRSLGKASDVHRIASASAKHMAHPNVDPEVFQMQHQLGARNPAFLLRVFDDLVNFSGETSVARCMKFFFEQQISDRRHFINRMREELQTSTNLLGQLTALIAELEAFPDPGEVFDTMMCLRDDMRDEQARVDALNDCIARVQEQIEIKEEYVRVMEAEDNDG